jgi:hypothetical protein
MSGDQPELLDYESSKVIPRWRRSRKFIAATAITAALLLAVVHASRPRPLAIPRTIVVTTAPATNDVSRALLLLLNNKDISSEVFTCPTTQPTQWDFGGGANSALNWNNWDSITGRRMKELPATVQNSFRDPFLGPDQRAAAKQAKERR